MMIFLMAAPFLVLALFEFGRRVDPITGRISRSPRPWPLVERSRLVPASAHVMVQLLDNETHSGNFIQCTKLDDNSIDLVYTMDLIGTTEAATPTACNCYVTA